MAGRRQGQRCEQVARPFPEIGTTENVHQAQVSPDRVTAARGKADRDADKSFRPSTRGVRVKAGDNWGHTGSEPFIRDVVAGWMALIDVRSKTGLAILSDYNEINSLYVCGGNTTVEPMYRITSLPAGQSVEYPTYVVPVVGLDNVVSATPDYIAGYSMKSDGKGTGQLSISAIRSVNSPESLSLKVNLMGVGKPEHLTRAGTLSFTALGEQVQTKELSFKGAAEDPLILKVSAEAASASGAASSYSFEDYWNGVYGWGENIQTDMATPAYRGERPRWDLNPRPPDPQSTIPPSLVIVGYRVTKLESLILTSVLSRREKPRYNVLYGDYSAHWFGDPKQQIIWWNQS
jgi:hypothetical protein